MTLKELAFDVLHLENPTSEAREAIASALERLEKIDNASPSEVESIRRFHESDLTRLGIDAGHPGTGQDADRDRATLLSIVGRMALEIDSLKDGQNRIASLFARELIIHKATKEELKEAYLRLSDLKDVISSLSTNSDSNATKGSSG